MNNKNRTYARKLKRDFRKNKYVYLMALLMNEIRSSRYKRVVLSLTYIPHFISVVVCGLLLEFSWSYSTAVGLFNSVINFTLLVLTNRISRRLSETSLW
ncbi:MAG: hypothetical protein JXA95_07855 [Spirochaetales bacterium]|nr:hypothetical protein [Spirochaetales bacterium]